MKTFTLALAAALLTATAASAQYYTPPPMPGYQPPPPPVSYNRLGSTIYGSDGTTINHLGSSTYIQQPGQPQRVCNTLGTTTYCQ